MVVGEKIQNAIASGIDSRKVVTGETILFSNRRAEGMGNKLVSGDRLMMAASARSRWCS